MLKLLTWNPVDGRGNLVFVTRLQRIHHAQHFGRIASSRSGVRKNEANGLFRVDDEDTSDGESDPFLIDIGDILMVQHVIRICHLPLFITNNRKS